MNALQVLILSALLCVPAAALKIGHRMTPNETHEAVSFHRNQLSQQAQWKSCFAKSGCHKLEGAVLPVCCKWCPYSVSCEFYWKGHVKPPMIQWFRGLDNTCTQPTMSISMLKFPHNPGLGVPRAGMNWATEAVHACVTVETTPDSGMRSMRCNCLYESWQTSAQAGGPHKIDCRAWKDTVCGDNGSGIMVADFESLRFSIEVGTNGREYTSRNGRCFPNNLLGIFTISSSHSYGHSPWASTEHITDTNGETSLGTRVYVDSNFELYNTDCGGAKV